MVAINLLKNPLVELIKMVEQGTYRCNYPENLDVYDIKTSSEWTNLQVYSCNDQKFTLPRHGDIIKEILVKDVAGDLEISLFYCDKLFWYKKVNVAGYKDTHVSLKYGLPTVCDSEGTFKIQVKGNYSYVFAEYLFLDVDDRFKVSDSKIETLAILASKYEETIPKPVKNSWWKFW